jgi:putative nucleotidyltransferase with HDIG domain
MQDREGFNSFANWLKARQVVVKQPGVAEVVEKLRLALKKQGDDLQKELEAVATILDCRVPWRKGHSNNVSRFALEVARKLGGFGQGEIELLRMACLLHDFGKFAVKEEILMKKGILTPEEMKLVRGHVEGGVLLLSPFEELRLILPAVREHHEHFDGRGYPSGLAQSEISLAARIITVADAYEAMLAGRPYRKKKSEEQAREELRKLAGVQFDPEIVRAFLE